MRVPSFRQSAISTTFIICLKIGGIMFHFLYRDFNWVNFVDWIIWRFNPPLEEIREELFAEVNIPYNAQS